MSSFALIGKIPFKCFFSNFSLFLVTPRIFGCVCFLHLFDTTMDKVSLRPIRCNFLRYSQTQRGYKCYDPVTKKIFVYANMTFFEFESFFKVTGDNYPILLPTLVSATIPPSNPWKFTIDDHLCKLVVLQSHLLLHCIQLVILLICPLLLAKVNVLVLNFHCKCCLLWSLWSFYLLLGIIMKLHKSLLAKGNEGRDVNTFCSKYMGLGSITWRNSSSCIQVGFNYEVSPWWFHWKL